MSNDKIVKENKSKKTKKQIMSTYVYFSNLWPVLLG